MCDPIPGSCRVPRPRGPPTRRSPTRKCRVRSAPSGACSRHGVTRRQTGYSVPPAQAAAAGRCAGPRLQPEPGQPAGGSSPVPPAARPHLPQRRREQPGAGRHAGVSRQLRRRCAGCRNSAGGGGWPPLPSKWPAAYAPRDEATGYGTPPSSGSGSVHTLHPFSTIGSLQRAPPPCTCTTRKRAPPGQRWRAASRCRPPC